MKHSLLYFTHLLTLLTITASQAQIQFEQVLPPPPSPQIIPVFEVVQQGSIALADVDGDSDQDVLITGRNGLNQPITKLYTNDGNGAYTEVIGTPFEGVYLSSKAFADIDGDNDQDVLITGQNTSNQPTAKLYTNDGNGGYTEVTGTPFDGVKESSVAFADIDSDSDLDVMITGENTNGQPIAKLYTNNGSGGYNEATGTTFDGVNNGSIAFADIDGDSDQDVLITGRNSSYQPTAKLYTNGDNGDFTEVIGTPFEGIRFSSIAFADIDGDSDQDVLITGQNSNNQPITKLYTNDSSGSFNEVTGTPFEGVYFGSLAFADSDGDNDPDVLVTGRNASSQRVTILYTNDGSGGYTEETGTPFDGVHRSSVAFVDIDGDNDQDVLITGENSSNHQIAKLYTNSGNNSYTTVTGTPFDVVIDGSTTFADIDGDGDQDVLITGENASNQPHTKLYTNDSSGGYTVVDGTPFDGVQYSSVAFADIEGDSDQDVLITGYIGSNQRIAKLYSNNASGSFTEVTVTPFEGIWFGSIAFADIDGDNDEDVLITGENNSFQNIAKLYTNDGSGGYTEVIGTPFEEVNGGSIAFADIDSDNDQDVLITGENSSGGYTTKLYTNDGSGSYTEVTDTPFDWVRDGSIAFADVDNDSDQDVLITGQNDSFQIISKLYTNDGSGTYSEVTGTPFDGVYNSSVAFADIDGDSDQDVLITGLTSSIQRIAKLYTNDGIGNYTEVTGTIFDGVAWGSIAFTDIDGDSDQDILITGLNVSNQRIAKLYRNLTPPPCTAPEIPILNVTPNPICIGNTAILDITGALNGATAWHVYSDSCGGTEIGTTTTGTFSIPNPISAETIFYVRGEGDCVTPGACQSISINPTDLDDASFSYSATTYLPTDSDPTPTINGQPGGSFSSTTGLSLNASNGEIDVSASTPGTYMVTYTTAGKCPNSSVVNVTIVGCDLQATIQITNVSCSGGNDGSLDLNIIAGTSPYTFLWSNGVTDEDIENLPPGSYTVTITDNDGCEISLSSTITTEDTENPLLNCLADQTVTLPPNQINYILPNYVSAGDVSASDNCSVSSIVQTPLAGSVLTLGVYTISFTATDDSGNTSNCSFTLAVEETLGTTSVDFENVNLFPNPTEQLVIIDNAKGNELTEMLIYDILGKQVMHINLSSKALTIPVDVSQLSSGTYLVEIRSEKNQSTKRLIKK